MEWLISACVLVIAGCWFWHRRSTRKERVIQRELDAIVEAEQSKPVQEAPELPEVMGEVAALPIEAPERLATLGPMQRRQLVLIIDKCKSFRQSVLLHTRSGLRLYVTPVDNGFVIVRDMKLGGSGMQRAKVRRFVCVGGTGIFWADEPREACQQTNGSLEGTEELAPEAYGTLLDELRSAYRPA